MVLGICIAIYQTFKFKKALQKMEPLVSIITPAFNASKYLVSFFESVLDQEYSNYELIFINDGSTDDTEEIALQYKKIFEEKGHRFVYLVKENGGQAAALNTGFPYMKGKYFIWPDSDDTLCSDNLSVKVDFMEKIRVSILVSRGRYMWMRVAMI